MKTGFRKTTLVFTGLVVVGLAGGSVALAGGNPGDFKCDGGTLVGDGMSNFKTVIKTTDRMATIAITGNSIKKTISMDIQSGGYTNSNNGNDSASFHFDGSYVSEKVALGTKLTITGTGPGSIKDITGFSLPQQTTLYSLSNVGANVVITLLNAQRDPNGLGTGGRADSNISSSVNGYIEVEKSMKITCGDPVPAAQRGPVLQGVGSAVGLILDPVVSPSPIPNY